MLAECAIAGETTADLKKQFRKTVIAGGSLKGARYLDVSAEDLAKAARSYRSDPRFQQFAKRWIASKTLGQVSMTRLSVSQTEGSAVGVMRLWS